MAAAIRGLDSSGICYAMIGGIAVIVRRGLRTTLDFDVLALASSANLANLKAALRAEGFDHDDRLHRIQLGDVNLLRFWRPHGEVFIDVGLDVQLTDSPLCESIVGRATQEDYLGTRVPVATCEDVILLKLVAYRPLDRSDAITLIENAVVPLDWPYVEQWADRLGLQERLEDVRRAASPDGASATPRPSAPSR